jgi:hypothetical protein
MIAREEVPKSPVDKLQHIMKTLTETAISSIVPAMALVRAAIDREILGK